MERVYRSMLLIRQFENRLLELFSEGKLSGANHTSVGQEAIAVSVIEYLQEDDVVFSNHRCHGHYLAREDDPEGLLAEIMGRVGSTCEGEVVVNITTQKFLLQWYSGILHAYCSWYGIG